MIERLGCLDKKNEWYEVERGNFSQGRRRRWRRETEWGFTAREAGCWLCFDFQEEKKFLATKAWNFSSVYINTHVKISILVILFVLLCNVLDAMFIVNYDFWVSWVLLWYFFIAGCSITSEISVIWQVYGLPKILRIIFRVIFIIMNYNLFGVSDLFIYFFSVMYVYGYLNIRIAIYFVVSFGLSCVWYGHGKTTFCKGDLVSFSLVVKL